LSVLDGEKHHLFNFQLQYFVVAPPSGVEINQNADTQLQTFSYPVVPSQNALYTPHL